GADAARSQAPRAWRPAPRSLPGGPAAPRKRDDSWESLRDVKTAGGAARAGNPVPRDARGLRWGPNGPNLGPNDGPGGDMRVGQARFHAWFGGRRRSS